MNHDEQIQLHGSLRYAIFRNGKLWQRIEQENLVVNTGKNALARLLGGGRTGGITKFGVGTNGTAAAVANANLTNGFIRAIGTATYPQTGQVVFPWQVAADEANGLNIQEMGLLFADNTLFARITLGAIAKTNILTLNGEWAVNF